MEKQNADMVRPLDRYLAPKDVWGISFGCMVGWGVFAMPGNTFLPVAGPLGTAIAMAVSVVIMLVIGSNFFYLMRGFPGARPGQECPGDLKRPRGGQTQSGPGKPDSKKKRSLDQ